jgi:hypothetical protein
MFVRKPQGRGAGGKRRDGVTAGQVASEVERRSKQQLGATTAVLSCLHVYTRTSGAYE